MTDTRGRKLACLERGCPGSDEKPEDAVGVAGESLMVGL